MNIFKAIISGTSLLEQGKALNGSTLLTNAEAGAAMLYAFISALVVFLQDLGINVGVGSTDLHTLSNGWSITLTALYGIYRIATNPAAGAKPAQ